MATITDHGVNATIEEVRALVATYVKDVLTAKGSDTKYHIVLDLARAVGSASSWNFGDKFDGQVTRTLEGLVADGTLTKVKKGDKAPGEQGWHTTTEPIYFTPAGYLKAVTDANQAQDDALDRKNRREALVARAQGLGLEVELVHRWGKPDVVSFSLEALETLVSTYADFGKVNV